MTAPTPPRVASPDGSAQSLMGPPRAHDARRPGISDTTEPVQVVPKHGSPPSLSNGVVMFPYAWHSAGRTAPSVRAPVSPAPPAHGGLML
jgi:hypothetical protein